MLIVQHQSYRLSTGFPVLLGVYEKLLVFSANRCVQHLISEIVMWIINRLVLFYVMFSFKKVSSLPVLLVRGQTLVIMLHWQIEER